MTLQVWLLSMLLVTSYTYTGNGSKETVMDPNGNVTTFEYEAGTLRLKKVIHPDETRVFDALNRPLQISEGGRLTDYYYDLAGRAVGLMSGNDQWSINEYDAQSRLVRRTLKANASGWQPLLAELTFAYDAVGTLGYDVAGNRTSKVVVGGPDSGTTTYVIGTGNTGAGANQIKQAIRRRCQKCPLT